MTIAGPTEVSGQTPVILMGPEDGSEESKGKAKERHSRLYSSSSTTYEKKWVAADPKHMLYKSTEFISLHPHKNSMESLQCLQSKHCCSYKT